MHKAIKSKISSSIENRAKEEKVLIKTIKNLKKNLTKAEFKIYCNLLQEPNNDQYVDDFVDLYDTGEWCRGYFKTMITHIIQNSVAEKEKEIFEAIEKRFEIDHFCQVHPEWCNCWQEFKDTIKSEAGED